MPDSHGYGDRLLRPRIPLVDVHVGTADRRLGDLDQYIVRADPGLRYVVQPDAGSCLFLYQCLHLPITLFTACGQLSTGIAQARPRHLMTPSSAPTEVNA